MRKIIIILQRRKLRHWELNDFLFNELVTKKGTEIMVWFPSCLYYIEFVPTVLPHFGCGVRGMGKGVFCLFGLVFFVRKRFKSKNCGFERVFKKRQDFSWQMKRWKQPGWNHCWSWCEICHWLLGIQNFTVRWSSRNKISKHQKRIVQSWHLGIGLGSE